MQTSKIFQCQTTETSIPKETPIDSSPRLFEGFEYLSIYGSSKKLLATSALLLVASALLVVARSYLTSLDRPCGAIGVNQPQVTTRPGWKHVPMCVFLL